LSDICLLCAAEHKPGQMSPIYTSIADYEYAVPRQSNYFECTDCGFVMQIPKVPAAEIPSLYPDDYLAYSKPKSSVFGALKRAIVARDARKVLAVAKSPAPRILEVGCGNGSLLESILEINPKASVCGIDIKDLGLSANPRIDFHLGQIEEVDLPDGSFDAIYCSNLIEHVVDPVGFIEHMRRLLRPGGGALVITPNHLSLDRYVFGRRWGGYHYPRHLTLFNHRNVVTAMRIGGLETERVSGAYAWWAISLANSLFKESARRGRGVMHTALSVMFLPLDLAINLFRPHGSMTIKARRPSN